LLNCHPITVIKARGRPIIVELKPGIVLLSVIDLRSDDRSKRGVPVFVRSEGVLLAVICGDDHKC
jgi:hypothetical protein